MVCHDRRRRRRQATVQLAPLHRWHRRVRRDRRDRRCRSHRRRHSHMPCRSWPRIPFARTVHSGAPSRRARAAIPLGATLRHWYRRRMSRRDQNCRQRFWRRTEVLLLLVVVDVMIASTVKPGLLYSASTSTRSTTVSPRSSVPSTAGLEPSTSNKRVWVGRHPRCRPQLELTRLAGGPGGADNTLHVSAPKKRRVDPGALLDLVVIGKIADEDVNDLLLGFVDIDRSQAGKQLVYFGKKKFEVLIPVVGDGFELPL